MIAWTERPVDEAALFNPAFCALLIQTAALSHERESKVPIHYASAFLVLPIVLHKATRDLLPTKVSTTMHAWLERNPSVRVGFPGRAAALSDVTREALILGAQQGLLRLDGGTITGGLARLSAALEQQCTDEVRRCTRASAFVGRWLARSSDPATAYMLWGIRP